MVCFCGLTNNSYRRQAASTLVVRFKALPSLWTPQCLFSLCVSFLHCCTHYIFVEKTTSLWGPLCLSCNRPRRWTMFICLPSKSSLPLDVHIYNTIISYPDLFLHQAPDHRAKLVASIPIMKPCVWTHDFFITCLAWLTLSEYYKQANLNPIVGYCPWGRNYYIVVFCDLWIIKVHAPLYSALIELN